MRNHVVTTAGAQALFGLVATVYPVCAQAPPANAAALQQEKARATATLIDRTQDVKARVAAVERLGYPDARTFALLLEIGSDPKENNALRRAALRRHKFDDKYFEVAMRILADPADGDEDLDAGLALDLGQRVTFRTPAEVRQRFHDVLRKLLDDPRDRVRHQAYRTLAGSHDTVALNRLTESLQKRQTPGVPLAEAIHLLNDDGPVNHIAAIRPYIDHQDPAVKAQAAIALCVDPQTRPKIVAMVTDSRTPREVRVMGLRGLARNDDRFAEYAIGIVQDAKADPEVRQAAMSAFAGRMNYNKVDDRTQVRFAEAVKRIAGDARSPKTLQAAAIRVARVPGKGLSGGRANEMIPRAVLLCGLCAFANAGSDAVPAIRQALSASNGATDHLRVAALLDQLRSLGGKAAPAGDTLSAMLAHRHPLYRGRDKAEVTRLRTHLYVTLSEIGVPASAIPPLLDTLAHFDTRIHPGEYGAAVRAVAALGPNGRRFIAYLLPALVEPMSEDEFSLVRYEPGFERHEATTIQLEIARCLGAVASRDDQEALRTLRELAQGAPGADRRVAREAQLAIGRIERRAAETQERAGR